MTATQDRLKETKEYVWASSCPEEAKDMYAMLLDSAAEAANGAADKLGALSQHSACLTVALVKFMVRAEGHGIGDMRSQAKPAAILRMAYPFRWPIVIALAAIAHSQNLPAILETVRAFTK